LWQVYDASAFNPKSDIEQSGPGDGSCKPFRGPTISLPAFKVFGLEVAFNVSAFVVSAFKVFISIVPAYRFSFPFQQ
jgi:hypothetical protein